MAVVAGYGGVWEYVDDLGGGGAGDRVWVVIFSFVALAPAYGAIRGG